MEEKSKLKSQVFTIPNILSVCRLCIIPIIIYLYCAKKEYIMTTVVIVISGLTDVVDGFIARRFNMISEIGKALDPVADKLTQIATLFCLIVRFPLMQIPLILLIIKEVASGIINLMLIKKTGEVHGAVWHGKLTTVCIYSLMIVHLLWANIPSSVSVIFIGICTGIMIMSCILYSIKNIGLLIGAKSTNKN